MSCRGCVASSVVLLLSLLAAPSVSRAQRPAIENARIEAVLDEVLAESLPDTARPAFGIAVATGDGVVAERVLGLADLELQVTATPASRFDWASVSKQLTAYAVSLLVEEGRLLLDDPVRRHLPELGGVGAEVRVRHLLHHTGGIEDVDGLLALAGLRREDDVSLDDLVALLSRQRHLRFFPGDRHAYSNGGYVLLAALVERVVGEPFEGWMERRVFRPLGMRASVVRRDGSALIRGRVRSYAHDWDEDVDRIDRSAPTPGAGSVVATVGDLARWASHLLAPRRDRAAALRLRERGRLDDGTVLDYAWGLSWSADRGVRVLGHAGSGPGGSSQVLLFPDLDLAIVAASASVLDPGAGRVARALADRLLDDVWEEPEEAPRRYLLLTPEMIRQRPSGIELGVAPESRIREAVGVYRSEDGTRVVVRPRPGALEMAIEGQRPWIPLYPAADGSWVLGALLDRVTFPSDGETGRAREMVRERTPRSVLESGEPRRVAPRVETELDRASAERYVGDYWSPELRTLYTVRIRDRASDAAGPAELQLEHARHGVLPLEPLGGHEFGVDSRLVAGARFAIDPESGRAIGVELEAYSWSVRTSFQRLEHPLEGVSAP